MIEMITNDLWAQEVQSKWVAKTMKQHAIVKRI